MSEQNYQVIKLANDTKHGLAAGLFSKSNSDFFFISSLNDLEYSLSMSRRPSNVLLVIFIIGIIFELSIKSNFFPW